jgi:hypothetical protein
MTWELTATGVEGPSQGFGVLSVLFVCREPIHPLFCLFCWAIQGCWSGARQRKAPKERGPTSTVLQGKQDQTRPRTMNNEVTMIYCRDPTGPLALLGGPKALLQSAPPPQKKKRNGSVHITNAQNVPLPLRDPSFERPN